MTVTIRLSKSGEPLFRQAYDGLRQAILSGGFRANDRLPSTRDLAEQLGISRTVVLLAYEQLLAEGYVYSRAGSGTYVSEHLGSQKTPPCDRAAELRLSSYGTAAAEVASTVQFPARRVPPPRYDFAYGRSDTAFFPFEVWRRILLRHARRTAIHAVGYDATGGAPALCEAIAVHLRRSRAVACSPSQVIVLNGSQQALDLIARVLIEPGDPVVVEEPQYQGVREILRAAGAEVCLSPVDREGLNPAILPRNARLVFVTPSHQFPTGATLPLQRRLALLAWARRSNAIVVEDDYDAEFRYDGQPVESLQGLDPDGRVVYVGTFSQTMFSALRIGYLIAPASLVSAFTAAKWLSDRHTATLEQEALAEFIASGSYERHISRVRRRNAARRKALLFAVEQHLGNRVEVSGDGAGAHIALWLKGGAAEDELIRRASARDVGVYGISRYFFDQPSRPGLMLGYSRVSVPDIQEGVRRLSEAFSERTSGK